MKIIILITTIVFLLNSPTSAQEYGWQLKKSGSVTGYPIFFDTVNDSVFFGVDSVIYRSDKFCKSLVKFGSPVPGIKQIKVIFRSSLRLNEFLIATQKTTSNTGQIYKSFDNCQTWNLIGNYNFAYFGIPVTQDHNNPDLLYTMNDNVFQKSTDFGSTWIDISINLPFGTPCDIEVFKDSSNIILVGENAQGIFRSSDYGHTWSQTHSTSGEIPTIVIQKTETNIAFATRWGGVGGVLKSIDHGLTWNQIPGPMFNNFGMWGVDILEADSSYIAAGEFSPTANIFITSDYGANWITVPNINQPNYALKYINDSILVAASGNGIYKLRSLPITNETQIKLVFSIDINDAVDFNTKKRIDTIATGVWIKGGLSVLGNNQGNWTFNDTINGLILPLKDDGTGYDSTANDNIWTLEIDVPPGDLVGVFSYKYGISYPGIDTINPGIGYLNNDIPSTSRSFNFQDTDTLIVLPQDKWNYRIRPIIAVSDTIISMQLHINETEIYSFAISNELGTDTLKYDLYVISDSITTDIFGSEISLGYAQGNLYGNIFHTDRVIRIDNFEQFFGLSSQFLVSFVIYQADSLNGQFERIFLRSRNLQSGTGFRSSNQIDLILQAGKYYFIGVASQANLELFADSTNAGEFLFGNSIGSSSVQYSAGVPRIINIGLPEELFYYQKIFFTAPTPWINPNILNGNILPGQSSIFDFIFNAQNIPMGNYYSRLVILSNDLFNDSLVIPVYLSIIDPSGIKHENIVPENVLLHQNYPNPFNPSTIIRYELPRSSYVTLKVYDLLGSELVTLVNEEKVSGTYEVVLDASSLSSGVYFYKLSAGSFVDTKKLLLIK